MTIPIPSGSPAPPAAVAGASNGGVASPAQAQAAVAPSAQPRDDVLTLTSSCIVYQRAFANTCGVPLGAHLDFVPSSVLRLPQIPRPPVRCNGCSGFMNAYCKTNLVKWVWKCNMCGAVNVNKEQLGGSADTASYPELGHEAVEYTLPLADSQLPPARPPHLVVAVDTTLDAPDLKAATDALLSTLSALPPSTRLTLISFDGCVAVHNLGAHRCSHVLPQAPGLSATAAATPAAAAPAAAKAADGAASHLAGLSLAADHQTTVQMLLDRHCSFSNAVKAGSAAAAPAPASQPAGKAPGAPGQGLLVAELGACAAQLPAALGSLRTMQVDLPQRSRARCLCSAVEAGLRLIAAHARLDLAQPQSLPGSRVLVLAGGPPTRGPGAVPLELLDQAVPEKGRSPEHRAVAVALDVGAALGAMGARIGVAVDVLTSVSSGFNAPLLTAIAHGSGGELVPQQGPLGATPSPAPAPSPSDPAASPPATQTGGFVAGLLPRQLSGILVRRFGLDGRLDCYCSDGLRIMQWMGPLDTVKSDHDDPSHADGSGPDGHARSSSAPAPAAPPVPLGSGPWRLSSAACGVAALEAGRGASLRLEVTRDLESTPFVVVQVALHWVDPAARLRVVRVVSRRLAVVESRGEFLRTVNPTAAAALLGKRAVLDAKKAGAWRDWRKAEEARLAVAAQLSLVATRCGVEVHAGRTMLGLAKRLWQWPPELMPLAYSLYHFQRGPVLAPPTAPPPGVHPATAAGHAHSLWDSDARLSAINTLLRSSWVDAYRAMAPKLYAVLPSQPGSGPGVQLAALPCVTLAAVMARTVPLVLDCGPTVLVSPTEEPQSPGSGGGAAAAQAQPGGAGHGAAAAALSPALVEAALAVTALAGPDGRGGVASGRFPAPAVALAPGAQGGSGALVSRLIPVQRDGYEEQCLQHPQLGQLGPQVAAQLSKQLGDTARGAAAEAAAVSAAAGLPAALTKQAAAAAASFVEWCKTVSVAPFPVR
ncbi:hypothetical protein HYH03_006408 [Edaphochlamys debaryana]|uniref:Protein transport protein SEC23 n=1 Tax=Edaphochlamys debaryana TaxID=47281 RepID=A0A836C1C4_9CHLO|nr:hypothetical protein HYH03_006408 [Edaphochlamys debaryana]|eukprot:KAG2495463.1 hypothetical protein HYH03_006408 [Edaphochlamys debaryana]